MFCFGQGTENIRKVLEDILKDLVLSQMQFESQVISLTLVYIIFGHKHNRDG